MFYKYEIVKYHPNNYNTYYIIKRTSIFGTVRYLCRTASGLYRLEEKWIKFDPSRMYIDDRYYDKLSAEQAYEHLTGIADIKHKAEMKRRKEELKNIEKELIPYP